MFKYRRSFKYNYEYELEEDYTFDSGVLTNNYIKTSYLELTLSGVLTVKKGYNWDSADCTAGTDNFMRGSLIHHILYQFIREGALPQYFRKEADKLLVKVCREDGMGWIMSKWVYVWVRIFGASSAKVE